MHDFRTCTADEPRAVRPLARVASAAVAVTAAAILSVGVAGAFPSTAGASQPPKACMDDKDAPGCPHQDDGGGGALWVADQFYQSGRNLAGWDFYSRYDGGAPNDYQAVVLEKNLGYSDCWRPYWTPKEIACK